MCKEGRLYTAKPIDGPAREDLRQRFEKMLGDEVALEFCVDSSLIGGFLALIDGKAYDNSIKARLEDMWAFIQEGER